MVRQVPDVLLIVGLLSVWGVYGVSALTAVVAQSPGSVSGSEAVSEELFQAQLEELIRSYPIAAAKTGMLSSAAVTGRVVEFFRTHPSIPLVVDPVMSASAGAELAGWEVVDMMRDQLLPQASLVTPNLSEAEVISGRKISCFEEFQDAAKVIFDTCGCDVLLKGGHFEVEGNDVYDILCLGGKIEILRDERLPVPDLHGTGCTLSAAITAWLASGSSMRDAVISARTNLRDWMINHHCWDEPRKISALNAIDRRR